MLEFWQPYLIAIAIGLLVGIEREKAQTGSKAFGVRTFLLIALAGALAGGLETIWIAIVISAFCLTLVALAYYNTSRTRKSDVGLTTEFAAAVVYTLAFLAHDRPLLAMIVGPIVALVLFSKASLHRLTERLKPSEFQTAVLLLLLGLILMNVIADGAVDPWGVFNPRKFGMIVLVLACLEFASYILAKILSERSGALVLGMLGGFVSSTAVLFSSAKQAARSKTSSVPYLLTVTAAQISSLIELGVIVGFVAPPVLGALVPPLGAALAVAFVSLGFLAFKGRGRPGRSSMTLRSPLDWFGVLRLAVLFAAMLAVTALARRFLGEQGAFITSILGGTFELHGMALANATMFANDQVSLKGASLNLLAAISASLAIKVIACWVMARGRFARWVTVIFSSMAAALWLAYFLAVMTFVES